MTHSEQEIFEASFWSRVDTTGDCWIWLGPTHKGFGRVENNPTGTTYAHRISYILTNGPVGTTLVVKQTCGEKYCVSPAHLIVISPELRFWKNVSKEDSCWPWTGYKDKDNYGRFSVNNQRVGVHRFSYELHKGAIPSGLVVRHTCDLRCCVNPEHLETGSQKENVRDMHKRNRASIRRGEKHHKARLTEVQARWIIDQSLLGQLNVRAAADEFGISKESVRAVARGDTWTFLRQQFTS